MSKFIWLDWTLQSICWLVRWHGDWLRRIASGHPRMHKKGSFQTKWLASVPPQQRPSFSILTAHCPFEGPMGRDVYATESVSQTDIKPSANKSQACLGTLQKSILYLLANSPRPASPSAICRSGAFFAKPSQPQVGTCGILSKGQIR